jgi:hypothetical protein
MGSLRSLNRDKSLSISSLAESVQLREHEGYVLTWYIRDKRFFCVVNWLNDEGGCPLYFSIHHVLKTGLATHKPIYRSISRGDILNKDQAAFLLEDWCCWLDYLEGKWDEIIGFPSNWADWGVDNLLSQKEVIQLLSWNRPEKFLRIIGG